jgi:hypothetical protein
MAAGEGLQAGPVREAPVHHGLGRKARGDLGNPSLHVLDGPEGIEALPDHHHSPHRLGPGHGKGSPAGGGAQGDPGHVPQADGDVARGGPNHRLLQVLQAPNEPPAPDDVLHPVDLGGARPDVQVGGGGGVQDLVQGHVVDSHGVPVNVHLVLPDVPADGGHLAHPLGGQEAVAHEPVLDAPELVQVPSPHRPALGIPPLQRIPEDLPQGGGVGPQCGHGVHGQEVGRERVELLDDPGPGPVELHPLLEDEEDHGQPERRRAPDLPDPRHPQEGGGEGVGDLVLHVLG